MAITTLETNGKVAVLTLRNGANLHNPAFVEALLTACVDIRADRAIKALVNASDDEKSWSQGIDLNWFNGAIKAAKHDEMRGFLYGVNAVFKEFLTLPVPVNGALTGHTFGNGAILACACDFRFMRADRGYFCFPEVDISIPFLPGMVAICRKAVPEHLFNELALTGRRVTAQELADAHVIEAAFPNAAATLEGAAAFARTFPKSRNIFAEQKLRLHGHILKIMETEDPAFIEPLNLTV